MEDWKYMAMVLDRLFLWLFTLACFAGSGGEQMNCFLYYSAAPPPSPSPAPTPVPPPTPTCGQTFCPLTLSGTGKWRTSIWCHLRDKDLGNNVLGANSGHRKALIEIFVEAMSGWG